MSWVLYHYPLCPFSRKVRIILKEKGIDFQLVYEKYWERRRGFLLLNPTGVTPLLQSTSSKKLYFGNYSLFEFIENIGDRMLPTNDEEAYRARSVAEWFDVKFYNEVTRYLLEEKVIKHLTVGLSSVSPNSSAIRAAKKNIFSHLDYLNYLLQNQAGYLCGEKIGLADFAAASQLSVLDYIGDVPWEYSPLAKTWYALVKSRPSFKPLLEDEVPGIYRSAQYQNPDF
jgi:glutathione S-transferase